MNRDIPPEIEALRRQRHEQPKPDGATVLDTISDFLARFVAYPFVEARNAHAVWIVHAHLMSAWDSTPRLAFLSPEPESGKTRALEVTELLVPVPIIAINVSPAYLFRKIGQGAAEGTWRTILYDEIDTVFGPKARDNEELRALLNAGHRKGAVAGRCVVVGKKVTTEEIPAYCAVAMAGIGNLPDTILSRAIVIPMRRRAADETVMPFRRRAAEAEGTALRKQITEWAGQIEAGVMSVVPILPTNVIDRQADIWEPLFAVADAAGGDWPKLVDAAAIRLIAVAKDKTHSFGLMLLRDLKTIFGDRDRLLTADILDALCKLDESPWATFGRDDKPLDSRRLAVMLKPYGVRSTQMRNVSDVSLPAEQRGAIECEDKFTKLLPEKTQQNQGKGYFKHDLADAWARYL